MSGESDQKHSTTKPIVESDPKLHNDKNSANSPHSTDYAPYPKLDPNDVDPPPPPQDDTWSSVPMQSQSQPKSQPSIPTENPVHSEARAPIADDAATTMPTESNPYISPAPAPAPSSVKSEWFEFFVVVVVVFFIFYLGFVCLENLWYLIWLIRYGGVG